MRIACTMLFFKDLEKSKFENLMKRKIGLVLEEINRHIRNLHYWAKPLEVEYKSILHFLVKEQYL